MESIVAQEKQGLINKRRHKKDRELKRLNVSLESEFKKKRDKIFERQDIEAESMPEALQQNEIGYLNEADNDQGKKAEDAREGLDEFRYLARGKKEVEIKDETEFSDGFRADGSYSDGYWREPTEEEIKKIEAEERWGLELARRINQFNDSRPVRSGSQKVRKIL